MKTITANKDKVITLGRLGENEYTRIAFDVAEWLEEMPTAIISLYNQRSIDTSAYPIAQSAIERDGNTLYWIITNTELSAEGSGKCEIVAIVDNVIAKSTIYQTRVLNALDGAGEAPEPWDSWQEEFVEIEASAQNAKRIAEEAAAYAHEQAESIHVDYTELSEEVDDIKKSVDGDLYKPTDNLLDFGAVGGTWVQGNVGDSNPYLCKTKINVQANDKFYGVINKAKMDMTSSLSTFAMSLYLRAYDASDVEIGSVKTLSTTGSQMTGDYTVPTNCKYVYIILSTNVWSNQITPEILDNVTEAFAYFGKSNLTYTEIYANYTPYPAYNDTRVTETKSIADSTKITADRLNVIENTAHILSINHRGYTQVAPENTIPAFKLSRIKGFKCVETDTRGTSDGIPMCLHDPTINRTARNADGSEIASEINLIDITYEQSQQYDFGIWKSSAYAGTKIPTLKEFLETCKYVGLDAFVEIKQNDETFVKKCVDIAISVGMLEHVTWTGFSATALGYIKDYAPTAHLGLGANTIDAELIASAASLKTTSNKVWVSASVQTINSTTVALCIAAGLPIVAWTVYYDMLPLDPYVTAMISDVDIMGNKLYQMYIE